MQTSVLLDLETEPVSLEVAAAWCKVDVSLTTGEMPSTEAQILQMCLTSARQWCEEYTGLSFGPKTRQIRLGQREYAGPQSLPYGPNQVVTGVTDQDGAEVSIEQFTPLYYAEYLKGMSINNTLKEDYGYGYWYTGTFEYENTYTITYTAGYAAGKLPSPIQMAILKTTLELYNNRENTVIGTIVADLPQDAKIMLAPYRSNVLFQ